MLHAKFQQFIINSFDAVTILALTYFVGGFQPEGPLKKLHKGRASYEMSTFDSSFRSHGNKVSRYFSGL